MDLDHVTSSIVANNGGYLNNGVSWDVLQYVGRNLSNDTSCGDATTMLISDPMLGSLRDNGGPSTTHALATLSPALCAALLFHSPAPRSSIRRHPSIVSTRPFFLLVGAVAACHSPTAPTPSPSPTPGIRFASGRGSLAVRVSDARTGALLQEPVAILLRGVAEFEGEPGEPGWVAFRDVPPGAYLLQVRRIGYVLRRDSVRVRPGVVDTVAAPLGVNLCDIGCDAHIVRRRPWWQFWRRGA